MLTGGAMISSYFARYKFSSYGVGDRVGCNIFFPWEFLRPLLKGGTVYVIPDDVIFLSRALAAFISENRISEVLFTPSLLQGILNSADHDHPVVRLNAQLVDAKPGYLHGVLNWRLQHIGSHQSLVSARLSPISGPCN